MGVFKYEHENSTPVSREKLYKFFIKDSTELIPKAAAPVQSIELVEGTGGAGSLKKFTIVIGGETKYLFHKVDGIDEANYGYNYSIVEGSSDLPDSVEKISFENKLLEGPNGGTLAKVSVTYHTKGDTPPSEEELNAGKAKGDALFKDVEAYLLAHPKYN
ncbi:Disease resistance response protein DRRG49-C [Senna tora]|uniref:Disease resistance response protein DRRG49-C n=1 Tax=Senna tora TaxID=362788 RepID=A0A834T1M2_9FABA|nr:Disease resistance response protein DRRG49-C [Senna tora]